MATVIVAADGRFDDGSHGFGDPLDADIDCDDTNTDVNPDAIELCDGIDNDRDGAVDEDESTDASTWYADSDGDGFGDPATSTVACDQPSGYVADATDDDCVPIDTGDTDVGPADSDGYEIEGGGGCDCATSGRGAAAGLGLLPLFLGLAGLRRRRETAELEGA